MLGEPGENGGISALGPFLLLEGSEGIERAPLEGIREALGIAEEEHRFASGAEWRALVLGGEESAIPEPGRERLIDWFPGDHDHEGREAFVFRAEAVAEP